jgi:hypothetical protein
MEARGMRHRLPSQAELRSSGANTLSAKVDAHGGLAAFGRRLGLPLASGRAHNGAWGRWDALAAELRRFVAEQREEEGSAAGGARQQPAGGGGESDGEASGGEEGRRRRAPPAFASRSWSSGGGGLAGGPASGVLLAEDGSLSSSDDEEEERQRGGDGGGGGVTFLPTQQQLRSAGRADLLGAIRQHGGSLAVARRLGWAVRHGRLPSEATLLAQLLRFAREREGGEVWRRGVGRGRSGVHTALLAMPTLRELREAGRADLAGAVVRLGGVQAFAYLLAWEQQGRRLGEADGGAAGSQDDAQQQQQQQRQRQEEEEEVERAREEVRQQLSQILAYPGSAARSGGGGERRRSPQPAPAPPQPAVVEVGRAVLQLIEARGWERRVPTKQVGGRAAAVVGQAGCRHACCPWCPLCCLA